MAIYRHPSAGQILICDFSSLSTKSPEMTKKRPVIVLSPRMRRGNYCTVVPLSTTAPVPVQAWNMRLRVNLPSPYTEPEVWVKGDMLYTISFERLYPFKAGKDEFGKRIYKSFEISADEMEQVWNCVFKGLGRFDVANHLDKQKKEDENKGDPALTIIV